MRAFYFGCYKHPGHYLWVPGMGSHSMSLLAKTIPWGDHVDGGLCPGKKGRDGWTRSYGTAQVEGQAEHHVLDGWTAVAFWDRSGDSRPGSNSAFIFEGVFTFEGVIARSKEVFPEIWKRITFEVSLRN